MIKKWKQEFNKRAKYISNGREVFYEVANPFLPEDEDKAILDIGSGDGSFISHLNLLESYTNVHLLDANQTTVDTLSNTFKNVHLYLLPEKMPFNDDTVGLIHLSHIIEHLTPDDLYKTLTECDRVIAPGGSIVISTPLMWERFYDDLSHVRPYSPTVLQNYMTKARLNATADSVSTEYTCPELVYRYRSVGLQQITSRYFIIEFFLRLSAVVGSTLGFRRYIKNGYTIVLQKNKS